MRINKATEEYISKLIREKASDKIAKLDEEKRQLYAKYDGIAKEFEKEVEALEKEWTVKYLALIKKFGVKGRYSYHEPCVHAMYHDEMEHKWTDADAKRRDELNTKSNELGNAVYAKQQEVIARLSLGGTAKDLDEMLANIKF